MCIFIEIFDSLMISIFIILGYFNFDIFGEFYNAISLSLKKLLNCIDTSVDILLNKTLFYL